MHSAHVPDSREKTTTFYGWYSNRIRGYRKQQVLGADASALPPVGEDWAPPEWIDDPVDADLPLVDPLTV